MVSDRNSEIGRKAFLLAVHHARIGEPERAAELHEIAEQLLTKADLERAQIDALEAILDPVIAGELLVELEVVERDAREELRAAAREAVEFPDGAR